MKMSPAEQFITSRRTVPDQTPCARSIYPGCVRRLNDIQGVSSLKHEREQVEGCRVAKLDRVRQKVEHDQAKQPTTLRPRVEG